MFSSCPWSDDKTTSGPDTCVCCSPSFPAFLILQGNEEVLAILRDLNIKTRNNGTPERTYQQTRKRMGLSLSLDSYFFEDSRI